MAEDIYLPSVPHLQGKNVHQKSQNVEPVVVPKSPKDILDRYKNVTLCCNIMHINGIVLLNTIYGHILFAIVSIIEKIKAKNIEYVIN